MSRYFLRGAQLLLLCIVVALPWIYGGRYMPARFVATVAAAVAIVAIAPRIVIAGAIWKSIRIPLGLMTAAVLLGGWQLTTLAADLSPTATAAMQEFAATPDGPAPPSALSYYVPGTRRQIAALVCAVAAMALGAVLFAETKAMLLLMAGIAGSGFLVTCSGLVQRASGKIGPYFQLPLLPNAAPFGPFVNRNAAGSLLALALAAAAGLTVWRICCMPRRTIDTRRVARLQWFLMHVDFPLLLALGSLITLAAGVFASLSRGTMLAAIIGSVAALLLAGSRTNRQSFFWLTGAVAAAAAAMGIWLVQSSALESRWASVLAGDILHESRWVLWGESLRAASRVQPFGAGLGAFYYAHTPFETHPSINLARNADNQYVETLVVGGVCGIGILAALIFVIIRSVVRMWRKAQSPEHIGLAAGATAMVLMQLVHACFDFAWYSPPIMFPLALWSGAVLRKAVIKRTTRKSTGESSWLPTDDLVPDDARKSSLIWGVAVTVLLLPGLAWAAYESGRSVIVDRAEVATRNHFLVERTTEEIDEAIRIQNNAITAYPDDGESHLRLAELWVERYAAELRREIDRDPVTRLQSSRYLYLQDPSMLNAAANLRERVGDEAGVKALRDSPVVKENLGPALTAVRRARQLCPFSPFTQTLIAQLCFLDEPASNDAFYLERAEKLSQGRADWLFTIGRLHLNGARPDRAWDAWKRAWSFTGADEDTMMQLASAYLKPEEILEKLIPDNPHKIVELADRNYSQPDFIAPRRAYYLKAARLLDAANMHSANDEHVRGVAHRYDGNLSDAETSFIAAVHGGEIRPEWYLDLAVVQAALGKRNDADANVGRYRESAGGEDPTKLMLRRAADLLRDTPKLDASLRRRAASYYLEAGAPTEAIAAARDAVEHDPADIETQFVLGKALLQTGDIAGARTVVTKVEAIAPGREELRELNAAVNAAAKKAGTAP